MKRIKTCSRSTVPKERFSDLAVIAMYYSERFEVEVDEICQGSFKKALSSLTLLHITHLEEKYMRIAKAGGLNGLGSAKKSEEFT